MAHSPKVKVLFLTLFFCQNVTEIKRRQLFLHKSYVDFTRDQYL